MKNNYDNNRHVELKVGDLVLIDSDILNLDTEKRRPSRKLGARWVGPYKITKKLSNLTYEVDIHNSGIHNVIQISRLKKISPFA